MTVQRRVSRGERVPRFARLTSRLPCVRRSSRSVDRYGEGSLKFKLGSVRKPFFFVINLVHHLSKCLDLVEHGKFLVDNLFPSCSCCAQQTSFDILTKIKDNLSSLTCGRIFFQVSDRSFTIFLQSIDIFIVTAPFHTSRENGCLVKNGKFTLKQKVILVKRKLTIYQIRNKL